MKQLKAILVDDNKPFRDALKNLLEKQYGIEIVGEVSNAEEFYNIKNYYQADIIFMDIMMPVIDGITLTRKILNNHRNLKIVAITMHFDKIYLTNLIQVGFAGCIFKDSLFEQIPMALEAIMSGRSYYPLNILLKE